MDRRTFPVIDLSTIATRYHRSGDSRLLARADYGQRDVADVANAMGHERFGVVRPTPARSTPLEVRS